MRECGTCQECCTALAVSELGKGTFQSCSHLCVQGCGIYEQRPQSCKAYQCLWLQGHLEEKDRPDKLGVIFTTTDHPEKGTLPMLVESQPGALRQPAVVQAVTRLLAHSNIVLMTASERRVVSCEDSLRSDARSLALLPVVALTVAGILPGAGIVGS